MTDHVTVARSDEETSNRKRKVETKDTNEDEEDDEGSDIELAYKNDERETVHWDPDSDEGKIVGYRIQILDMCDPSDVTFRLGRIVGYDAFTNKHRILFDDSNSFKWIWLEEEVVQLYGEVVWAKVKGFSWWPAQVLIRDDADESLDELEKKKPEFAWRRVSFFDHPDVTNIKDAASSLKPFTFEDTKNPPRKKNVLKAYNDAVKELTKTNEWRKKAIIDLATKAFRIAQKVSNGILGRKLSIFRNDLGQFGKEVKCIVRNYSPATNKWLVAFDNEGYDAMWINVFDPKYRYKIMDHPRSEPTPADLAPFSFGLNELHVLSSNKLKNMTCISCMQEIKDPLKVIKCSCCSMVYHPMCLDPPVSCQEVVSEMIDEGWVCGKCTECTGCNRYDIIFGCVPFHPPPKSLAVDDPYLCSACIPQYQMERYCANCGHCWDEVRYEKDQKAIERIREKRGYFHSNKKARTNHIETSKPLTQPINFQHSQEKYFDPLKLNPSLFRPGSSTWGFNEGAMLACDSCNVWVHAGCAGLTEDEYERTTSGEHPIYSKDFLCQFCTKKRSELLIKLLKQEDVMGLFAMPVTEDMAPTYRDVVKHPMDLHTMMRYAHQGRYFTYCWVRDFFELMTYNALIFNRPTSKFWNEAKRFYKICLTRVFERHGKATLPGNYFIKIVEQFRIGEDILVKELKRIQQDKSVKKKDMIVGEAVETMNYQKTLATPTDAISCVPCAEIQLSKLEAHYCSWMEACFTCGSSGAADTMLFCIDCGEAYHSFCVNAPIFSMNYKAIASWRCPNCKICEIAGTVPVDETKLLYCEMCDRGFTLDLLDPPLSAVPPGLWVCGNCVDCKVCHNKSDQVISRKHWSRDPERCYACGGCSGIPIVDSLIKDCRCNVCNKFYRKDDPGVIRCKKCKSHVHLRCDYPNKLNILRDEEKWKGYCMRYECPSCRHRPSKRKVQNVTTSRLVRPKTNINLPSLQVDPKILLRQMKPFVSEEINWQVKSLWASEYKAIAIDGVRILINAKQKLGVGWENIVLTKDPRIPNWVLYRSARFMRFVKNSMRAHIRERKCQPVFDSTHLQQFFTSFSHISSLVNDAKNAAAFIYLACIYLRLDVKTQCKYRERLRALVVPTDLNGTCQYPVDSLNIITPFLEQLEQEGGVSQEETAAEALLRLVVTDRTSFTQRSKDVYKQLPISPKPVRKSGESQSSASKENISRNSTKTSDSSSLGVFNSEIPHKACAQGNPHNEIQGKSCALDGATEGQNQFSLSNISSEQSQSLDKLSRNGNNQNGKCLSKPSTLSEINCISTNGATKYGTKLAVDDISPMESLHRASSTKCINDITFSRPLLGWSDEVSKTRWRDPRSCCLCRICGDDDGGLAPSNSFSSSPSGHQSIGLGRLLPLPGGSWVHTNCSIWSSEVWDSGRGQLRAVEKAKSRGAKLKCFGCGRNGASVGCAKANCSRNYHFLCAIKCGAVFTTKQTMYCKNHASTAQDIVDASSLSFEIMRTLKIVFNEEVERSLTSCMRIGTLVIHTLGAIEREIDCFHDRHHIYCPGYTATRIFWSSKSSRLRILYLLKIEKGKNNKPRFIIIPSDCTNTEFSGKTAEEAYSKMIDRVLEVNGRFFAQNDLASHLPIKRKVRKSPEFLLNGHQFFGYGLHSVRKAIEQLPGCEAVALPLSESSQAYNFCFHLPNEKKLKDLQRKRAAKKAENSLSNSTGCARTEGFGAVRKSGGSGRITRALVRKTGAATEDNSRQSKKTDLDKQDLDSITYQEKYKDLKSIPMDERLIAKRSHIHGWGLFTKVDIPKNSMVVEYMGETIRQLVADRREREYERSGIGSCYMFRLDLQRIVDATMIGCMARFMNHCCQPNAYAKVINVDLGSGIEKKIIIFAQRDVVANEEITYDYKFPVEDGSLRCTCGAPNCIGRMN